MSGLASERMELGHGHHSDIVLAALCVGIEEYQPPGPSEDPDEERPIPKEDSNLTNAGRDARALRQELLAQGLQDENLFLLAGYVTGAALKQSITSFLECVREQISNFGRRDVSNAIPRVVFQVAAHAVHWETSELPVILTSDRDMIDLDALLAKPLDMLQSQGIEAVLLIDTCREDGKITTWNTREPGSKKRFRSRTDFTILLACDRGRVAYDNQKTMTMFFIDKWRNPELDLEAACQETSKEVDNFTLGQQRPWIYTRRGSRGNVAQRQKSEQHLLHIYRGAFAVSCAVVVILLWDKLETSLEFQKSDPGEQAGKIVVLDVFVLFQSLSLDWLTVQEAGRSPLQQYWYLTFLWVFCRVMNECSFEQTLCAKYTAIVSSLGYNLLNISFLGSSILVVLRLLALHPELKGAGIDSNTDDLTKSFLKPFLATACVGALVVMYRCHHSAEKAEFIQHEAKLYSVCLYLGTICSIVAWIVSRRMKVLPHQQVDQQAVSSLKQASWWICGLKTVWCCATLLWPSLGIVAECHFIVVLAFIVERICAVFTLRKLKELATGLNKLPQLC